MTTEAIQPVFRIQLRHVFTILGCTTAIVLICVWLGSTPAKSAPANSVTPPQRLAESGGISVNTPMIMPAFQQPTVVSAAEASLQDDSPIIGVTIGGVERAYSVLGMSGPATHVINDWMNNTAVTVAYCDRTDCTRVFTSAEDQQALDMRVAGWFDGQMSLALGDDFYQLNSQDIPLQNYEFVRMSWGEWKRRHPTSDVFLGGLGAEFGSMQF